MTNSTRNDELLVMAAKVLLFGAGLTIVASTLIWLDMRSSEAKGRSDASDRRPHEDAREPQVAPTTFERPVTPAPRRRPLARVQTTYDSADTGDSEPSTGSEDEVVTDAEQEARRYEDNEQKFNMRLTTLEEELASGQERSDVKGLLDERLTRLLSERGKLPTQFATRCSESVCELSVVSEGETLDFAMTAAMALREIGGDAAHGQAEGSLREGFDAAESIVPSESEVEATEDPAASEEDAFREKSSAVRSIRYLIDAADLKLDDPAGLPQKNAEPSGQGAADPDAADPAAGVDQVGTDQNAEVDEDTADRQAEGD